MKRALALVRAVIDSLQSCLSILCNCLILLSSDFPRAHPRRSQDSWSMRDQTVIPTEN